ncbi:hypothetical protein C365_03943 [Cryptococcus neoformans Bt85]|nr:hypothetical protein C365_03943 [Cryptococcus neoformans var. grubii Bt85]
MNGTQNILGASFIDKKRMRKKEECGRHWATGVQRARQKKWGGRGPRNHQPKEGKRERLAPGIKRRWTSRRRANSRRFRSEESSFTMNINMGLTTMHASRLPAGTELGWKGQYIPKPTGGFGTLLLTLSG